MESMMINYGILGCKTRNCRTYPSFLGDWWNMIGFKWFQYSSMFKACKLNKKSTVWTWTLKKQHGRVFWGDFCVSSVKTWLGYVWIHGMIRFGPQVTPFTMPVHLKRATFCHLWLQMSMQGFKRRRYATVYHVPVLHSWVQTNMEDFIQDDAPVYDSYCWVYGEFNYILYTVYL